MTDHDEITPESRAVDEGEASIIEVTARLPTPGEMALVDYATKLMQTSPDRAVEFHKTMLAVSATFGTLTATLPTTLLLRGASDTAPGPWLFALPPMLMIASSVCFALGFFPRSERLNPSVLDQVRRFRDRTMRSRRRLAVWGMIAFCLSITMTTGIAICVLAT